MMLLDTVIITKLIAAVPLILLSLPLIPLAVLLSGTPLGQLDTEIVVFLWNGTLVLAVILVPTLRRRRFLRRTASIVCVSALCTYSLEVADRAIRQAQEAAYQLEVERNTFRLDAPRSFDGIEFPAGSKVELSIKPPHHLESGEVPVPTQVLGLNVIGRFRIQPPPSKDPSASPKEVLTGTLATNAAIRTVPCGPGRFQNTGSEIWFEKPATGYYRDVEVRPWIWAPNEVQCTLASDFPIAGAVLRSGAAVDIRFRDDDGQPAISGELAQEAALEGIACAPGRIYYSQDNVACVASRDQDIRGALAAAGERLFFDKYCSCPGRWRFTLARPAEIAGLSLPGGTEMDVSASGETGLTLKSFVLAAGEKMPIQGAIVTGRMNVHFNYNAANIYLYPAYPDPGTILFEGRVHPRGAFDGARWTFKDD